MMKKKEIEIKQLCVRLLSFSSPVLYDVVDECALPDVGRSDDVDVTVPPQSLLPRLCFNMQDKKKTQS